MDKRVFITVGLVAVLALMIILLKKCSHSVGKNNVPGIYVSASEIVKGEYILFDDTSSTEVKKREWNFGDGSPVSSEKSGKHVYASTGIYWLKLYNDDMIDSLRITVKEPYQPAAPEPELTIEVSPNKIYEGEPVRFKGTAPSTATSWRWTFEVGSIDKDTTQNPKHIFKGEGKKNVRLSVKVNGIVYAKDMEIIVYEKPIKQIQTVSQKKECDENLKSIFSQYVESQGTEQSCIDWIDKNCIGGMNCPITVNGKPSTIYDFTLDIGTKKGIKLISVSDKVCDGKKGKYKSVTITTSK